MKRGAVTPLCIHAELRDPVFNLVFKQSIEIRWRHVKQSLETDKKYKRAESSGGQKEHPILNYPSHPDSILAQCGFLLGVKLLENHSEKVRFVG